MIPLKKSNFRPCKKNIYGFDIETYNKNKNFYCGSIYDLQNDSSKVFYDKYDMIDEMLSRDKRNSIMSASNLGFDFHGLFFDTKEIERFTFLYRGSNMLTAKTYLDKRSINKKGKNPLTFLDTGNYAMITVEKWGKLLNIPKLKKPEFLGKKPSNKTQKDILTEYNIRDSTISAKAMRFLYDMFENLKASPKMTISSTAMSCFKNNYLKDKVYWRHSEDILIDIFKGFYGGRTEAFARGKFENYNYYDFNSLYPSVMVNEYPDPNSMRISHINSTRYIDNFEGMSDVDIYIPYMDYPLLPTHTKNKMMFCYGNLSGYYTHVELRKAVDLGAVIKKVRRTIYYTENCYPFRDYVLDLYALRRKLKKDKDPTEYVVKLLLNSLFGKFSQRFLGKDNLIHKSQLTFKLLDKLDTIDPIGDYYRIQQDTPPAYFCFPMWSAYVTAYGRIKLHEILNKSSPLYCDTDSIITRKDYGDSSALGKLQLEHRIKKGIIVRPKFYMIQTSSKDMVKIKGVNLNQKKDKNGVKMVFGQRHFLELLSTKKANFQRFTKIREALRRGLIPNEIQDIEKVLSLEDDKRLWENKFNFKELQYSNPHEYSEIINNKDVAKAIIPQLTIPQL